MELKMNLVQSKSRTKFVIKDWQHSLHFKLNVFEFISYYVLPRWLPISEDDRCFDIRGSMKSFQFSSFGFKPLGQLNKKISHLTSPLRADDTKTWSKTLWDWIFFLQQSSNGLDFVSHNEGIKNVWHDMIHSHKKFLIAVKPDIR